MSRLEVDLFDTSPDPDLLCAICQSVLFNPTEASMCRHVFCHECIVTWVNSGARTCPTCRVWLTSYDLVPAVPALCNVIGRLVMRCVNHAAGCSTRLAVEQLETHLRNDCQFVTERCECGTELLRRHLEAHKDVCQYACINCDLMITGAERNTHNCLLALQQAISGQKYLLRELGRQFTQTTSLSQQLQTHLARFDWRTRNYSSSLTAEFIPSTHSSTATSARLSRESSPSASTSSNHHAPAGESRQSEQNAVPTVYGGASSQHDASIISISDSENESEASVSRSAYDNHTARDVSDTDEDDDFNDTDEHNMTDVDEDGDDENSIGDNYQSRSPPISNESRRWILPTPTVSEDEFFEQNDNENSASRTGSSQIIRIELDPVDDAEEHEQPENAATAEQDAGLSKEQEGTPMTLRQTSTSANDDDDGVQLSPAASSHDYSNSDSSDLPVYYNPNTCHYRGSCSSSSLPASPSLQDVNHDEVLPPSSFRSHLHDDDDEDDANSTRHNSNESSAEEDTQSASPRRNLRSSSDSTVERKSRAVSPALSTSSSSTVYLPLPKASRQSSGGHSSTGSSLCSLADSDGDSDDSGSLADVRGVKRRRIR